MMKFSLLIPIVILCACASADVASVRREVTRVEAMKLTTESRGGDGLFIPLVTVSVSRDSQGVPRKIELRSSGASKQKRETIYLQGGLPLFVSVKEDKLSIDAKDNLKVTALSETRLYFDKGHLIEERVGKKLMPLNAARKISIEANTKKRIRSYLSRYQFA